MNIAKFTEIIGSDFYTGIPDSQLKTLCDFLMDKYGIDPKHHVIAANEGNCTALAAGYHLATGKIPVVYLQNSGEGNILNPVVSLLNEKVYAIPVIFIIGWRGEPGTIDEPQHIFQGEITTKILDELDIKKFMIGDETTEGEVIVAMDKFRKILSRGKSVAFVIRKGALTGSANMSYENQYTMNRESIIEHILSVSGDDPVISTTGKASREVFEIREKNRQTHKYDFLTVGSMGHASSIALGIAINKPLNKIWCIDGDGAALMHMGSIAVIGSINPRNLIHIVINNGAHETVGGMPTVGENIDFILIAKACGYSYAARVDNFIDLDNELENVKNNNKLSFLEIKSSIGARKNLGRPTTSALENKENFMNYLKSI